MATNIQTLGDEAIYVPWPGYTGTPTPTSGKTIAGLTGKKELRTIKDSTGKVIWAHKWRLNLSGENCTFAMTSNDTNGFTKTGNVGRCKNGKTITVTVSTDSSSGRVFKSWSDGSTDNPRTFLMTEHKTISIVTEIITHTVRFFRFSGAADQGGEGPVKTMTVQHGALATPPSNVSILGWTFDEWYSLGRVSYISDPITEDTDFYGNWHMQLPTEEVRIRTGSSDSEYFVGASNNNTEIYNYRQCWALQSNGAAVTGTHTTSGRTFVIFNKDPNTKGAVGYDLPIGACVSSGINATIKHTASPVNHYISIAACIAFSFKDATSLKNLSYTDIKNSFGTDEFKDNIYDFSNWGAITAPREIFTLCIDGETADVSKWIYWSYDSSIDEYVELDVNDGDPVGGYHKTPKDGSGEFTLKLPASGEADITKENGYIVVDMRKLTKSELKDMGIPDGNSCTVPWYVTITLNLQLM